MNRRTFLLSAVVFWLSVGWTGLARGQAVQDDILKWVPEEAIGFVLVNRLQETSDKIDEIAKFLPVPPPSLLASISGKLSLEKGFDKTRSAALIVMSGETLERTAPVLLVPVTNFKEFISQFEPKDAAAEIAEITMGGEAKLAAPRGRYAAITETEFKSALEQVLKAKSGVSATLPKALGGWLAKNEASAVLTPGGIKLLSAAGLAQLAQAKLKRGQPPAPGAPPVTIDPAMMDFGEDFLKSLPSEVTHAGLGLWVDPSNAVHLTTRVMFVPSGSLAKEAGGITPPKGDLFAHIPAGPFVFAWASSAKTSLSRKFSELFGEMMRSNPAFANIDATQVKQLRDAMAETGKGVQLNSGVMGIPMDKETIFARSVNISQVDDAKAYLAGQEKMIKVMSEIVKNAKPALITYDVKMGKLDDRPMLEMTMAAAAKGPPGAMNPGLQMLGPNGKLATYMVAVDNKTVVTAYVSEDIARQAVERYLKGGPNLNSDPEVAKTAAVLPNGSQMRAYLSPHGLVAAVKSVLNNMGLPFGAMIPDLPETPPIGMAARVAPAGLATDLIVPGEVFEAIGGAVATMRPPRPN